MIIFIIGIVQTIVDLGWIAMIKINANLKNWREAYKIVATQRTQKIFIIPFLVDISFILLSVGLFLIYGMKL